jgi:cholesterol transport system auxiliary component
MTSGLPTERLTEGIRWSSVALEDQGAALVRCAGIEYRLLYEDPLKLRSYAASRWAGHRANCWRSGCGSNSAWSVPMRPDVEACLLRIELQEFSQLFATPQRSSGLLQGSAITARHQARIIAEQVRQSSTPAALPTRAAASWRWQRRATNSGGNSLTG